MAAGDPVAQLDQGEHVVGDDLADLLAGRPRRLPFDRVAGGGEHRQQRLSARCLAADVSGRASVAAAQ